jgi:signal transduction histidine kinase/DNA-binding response OmpR family regulator
MDSIVTQRFLQRRFRIATLVLLFALISSAAAVLVQLQAQADRTNYVVAFHRLGTGVMQLHHEVENLISSPDHVGEHRAQARTAFTDLFAEYRAIAFAPGRQDRSGRVLQQHHDQLAALDGEFGVDPAAAAASRNLKPGAMCPRLTQLWEGQPPGADDEVDVGLGDAIAELLVTLAPVLRGTGALTASELPQLRQIDSGMLDPLRATLREVSIMPEATLNRMGERTIWFITVVSGLGIAAALLNLLWIFRPMARAVLANQAEIIAQRDKAVAAENAKRNFLSIVSHELRTPMNGVLGFASLLLNSDLRPEHRKQVEVIQSSGKALLALVNDILDFSKLEAGSLELEEEDFSIEEVVSGVATLLRGAAQAKGLDLQVKLDPRLPERSCGDGNRLRQVLTNLLGNAIKFTDNGRVVIDVRKVSGAAGIRERCEIELAVSDTGIGIPAELQEMIFERFTQVDSSTRRRREGTGLGLAISKQLTEKMGGRIWVESAPDEGATFYVRVPFADAVPPAPESEWRAQAVAALSGRRVLVVDDNALNRRIFRLQLESYGLRVDDAASAAEALRLAERAAEANNPYEVTIIDHMMPEADGVDLARRIRAHPRIAGLPLVLSSSAGVVDPAEANQLGFDAVAEKPVQPQELIRTVWTLMGDRSPSAAGPRARLLVVEDNPVGREPLSEMFFGTAFRVDTVANGDDAVQAASRLAYDMILMDIRMPIVGGVEAARRIRALGGTAARIPIVAVTANAGIDTAAEYAAVGMRPVVPKPFDRDRLIAAIEDALAGSGAAERRAADFRASRMVSQ